MKSYLNIGITVGAVAVLRGAGRARDRVVAVHGAVELALLQRGLGGHVI